MTNPRSRDLVAQSHTATERASLRAVDLQPTGNRALDDTLRLLKSNADILAGFLNPWDRAARMRDLAERGLTGGTPQTAVPGGTLGVPVWTSRGRFELVTQLALATALQDFLSSEAGTVTAKEFADLQAQVRALAAGISAKELAESNSRLETRLRSQWTDAIQAAVTQAQGVVSDIEASISRLKQEMVRGDQGYVHRQTVAASTWNVAHLLEKKPLVMVVNASDEIVFPDVSFTDLNNLVITHGAAITGLAVCR